MDLDIQLLFNSFISYFWQKYCELTISNKIFCHRFVIRGRLDSVVPKHPVLIQIFFLSDSQAKRHFLVIFPLFLQTTKVAVNKNKNSNQTIFWFQTFLYHFVNCQSRKLSMSSKVTHKNSYVLMCISVVSMCDKNVKQNSFGKHLIRLKPLN